ncbi:MAG: GNAT family N-acetyltransferase [Gammaproteobacteria bacterium]|nr:GNAT family N-acetyltransferase [Gammaproteobacteria bacterium]
MPVTLYDLKHIDTPRLFIRPVQLGDEVLLHESIERSLPALERWMPWARGTNFEATRDFIHRGFTHWQSRTSRDFPLLVIHKDSQKVISASGFNEHSNLDKPCLEIGYWMDSTFVGQGLATELVNALTRFFIAGIKCDSCANLYSNSK